MGVKNLVNSLKEVLSSDKDKNTRKRQDALKKVLKKLNSKHDHLKKKHASASGDAKDKLAKKIKVVKAHTAKAEKALKDMEKD